MRLKIEGAPRHMPNLTDDLGVLSPSCQQVPGQNSTRTGLERARLLSQEFAEQGILLTDLVGDPGFVRRA